MMAGTVCPAGSFGVLSQRLLEHRGGSGKLGMRLGKRRLKRLVDAGLAGGRVIKMDNMILHQLLQGSR